jgi:hypothetical protein
MVNHRGSASPIPVHHNVPGHLPQQNYANGGTAEINGVPFDRLSTEPTHQTLLTPPSSCELDDLPAIFDMAADTIYASVNELPKRDGTSLSQLPLYAPPIVTDEPYRDQNDDLPIVPVSKFCLERYYVPVKEWEPPNRHYRQMTPESEGEMPDISREVQVEAMPTFAPAGNGIYLKIAINQSRKYSNPSPNICYCHPSTYPSDPLVRVQVVAVDP